MLHITYDNMIIDWCVSIIVIVKISFWIVYKDFI